MTRRAAQRTTSYREWKGGYRPYDLVKEASIALGVVLALALVLTILFSSPDEQPSTIKQWSRTDPVDFVTTATTELDGSSGTGGYGPPYNHASERPAHLVHPPRRSGSGSATRSTPRRTSCSRRCARSPGQPALQSAISTYESAPPKQQTAWTSAYEKGLGERQGERGRLDLGARRQLRAGADDDERAADLRPEPAASTARC